MTKKPTCEEIFEDELTMVHDEIVEPWRWGDVWFEVYHRGVDDTYWSVCYRVSTDGETNELREGLADIHQVRPEKKVVETTEWMTVEEEK